MEDYRCVNQLRGLRPSCARSEAAGEQTRGGTGSKIDENPILRHEIPGDAAATAVAPCNGIAGSDRESESRELCYGADDEPSRASEPGNSDGLPRHTECANKSSGAAASGSRPASPGRKARPEPRR